METEFTIIKNDQGTERPMFSREEIAGFLKNALEQYGDTFEAILKCISYAYGDNPGQNGFVLIAHREEQILGVVVINDTNMGDYIPEHILVYIAVDPIARGMGVGKGLMKRAIENTDGDIALHVEPENPAKFLYEKFGFTNKYLEMRLKK